MDYLGHHIDAQGIHVALAKVDALQKAPAPHNVSDLRFFLGMINYYVSTGIYGKYGNCNLRSKKVLWRRFGATDSSE